MIDHLSLGVADFARSLPFYDALLRPLGFRLMSNTGAEAGFGNEAAGTPFYLYPVEVAARGAVAAPGTHVAFACPDAAAVDAAFAAAMAAGAAEARAPARRPELSAHYYGAIVLDPDGHRLELVASLA